MRYMNNNEDCEKNVERENNLEHIQQTLDEIKEKQNLYNLDKSITLARLENNLNGIKLSLGRIETEMSLKDGKMMPFSVFSQWGEDGIIQYLIHNLTISNPYFVEFGVEDYRESNTRFLLINNNWRGLVMDGNEKNVQFINDDSVHWNYDLSAVCAFITAENINELLRSNAVPEKIGLLSIDIDGNDYWVWEKIDVVDPDIVICEYNPRFGKDEAVTIPYRSDFSRISAHYSGCYFGASYQALKYLGQKKGYAIVAGTQSNLFFVKKKLLNNKIKEKKDDDVYMQNHYEDTRDQNGNMKRISYTEEQKIIHSLPLVQVK